MDKPERAKILRNIPSVDELLIDREIAPLLKNTSHKLVVDSIRHVLEAKRRAILESRDTDVSDKEIIAFVKKEVERRKQYSLKRIINATGVVVHTNLGRSLLCEPAISQVIEVSQYYSNLEFDLKTGKRGTRYSHVEGLLCELTGAESAMVVNNNAGGVFLTLNTLAKDREVIVSRGQLVEIGGAFRIPDVMASSGARLVEIGTTNRTHLKDYEEAITNDTSLIMKVHTSNFKIVGFTTEVELKDLVSLGGKYGISVIEDLGSGNLIDFSKYGLMKEPTVQEVVHTGADVVMFSGDKMLGGPQAGIIVGKKEFIDRIKKNPINRALRIDKLTLTALEATLRLYRDEEKATHKIPTLKMLTLPMDVIKKKAKKLYRKVTSACSKEFLVEIVDGSSKVGGGALPLQELPTKMIAIYSNTIFPDMLEEKFRHYSPPIIGRIEKDRFLMDVRTLHEVDFPVIEKAVKQICRPQKDRLLDPA